MIVNEDAQLVYINNEPREINDFWAKHKNNQALSNEINFITFCLRRELLEKIVDILFYSNIRYNASFLQRNSSNYKENLLSRVNKSLSLRMVFYQQKVRNTCVNRHFKKCILLYLFFQLKKNLIVQNLALISTQCSSNCKKLAIAFVFFKGGFNLCKNNP